METIAAIIQTMNIAFMGYLLTRIDRSDEIMRQHEKEKHHEKIHVHTGHTQTDN